MSYKIELVKKEDAEAMLAYLKQVGSETDYLLFDARGVPMSLAQEEAFLDNVNQSPNSRMFVAKEKDVIIGNAYIHSNPRERIQHKAEIAISVLQSHWNKGVGSRLMETILDFAKSTPFMETIYLEVATTNAAAIRLYQKFGFETYGVNKKAIKLDKDTYLDWYLMRLDLVDKVL